MLLTAASSAAQVILGFDLTRGGSYNLQAQNGLRNAITDALPKASFSYTSNLTSDLLGNAAGVVLMSPFDNITSITALSGIEQTALRDFVQRGGFAVVLTDNNSTEAFSVTNTSFVSPFGFGTAGNVNTTLTILNPAGNPISNGPFGLVTSLQGVAQGYYTATADPFKPLAQVSGGQIVAGYFEQNALGLGSGAVLFVGDANVFHDGWATSSNYDLLSNFVAFAAVPEPSTFSLLLLGSGAAGLLAWRKRRRPR